MTVVSVSMNDDNIDALDRIQAAYGLSGRSEAVRASINAALGEIKELEDIEGDVEGVLVIVRGNHEDPWMARIQGSYSEFIKTQLHSHMKNRKCLEVMIVSCPSDVFSRMIRDIKSEGKADYVRFVRARRFPSYYALLYTEQLMSSADGMQA